MTFVEFLKSIGVNHLTEKNTVTVGASTIVKCQQFQSYIVDLLGPGYVIKGSAGKGNWAEVPWIAIFDESISTTAQEGYDIVFLFSLDMKKLYLTLNQGYSYFEDEYGFFAKQNIKKVAQYWREKLGTVPNGFSCDPINLSNIKNHRLAKGYEAGCIFAKEYDLKNLPSQRELEDDLRVLKLYFQKIKSEFIGNSFKTTNEYILTGETVSEQKEIEEDKKSSSVIDVLLKNKNIIFDETNVPDVILSKHEYKGKATKQDYEKKAAQNRKKGYYGELFVKEYEKQKFVSARKQIYIKDIIHLSHEEGDGAGYDIESRDLKGDKIYIEVKTTSGDINTPFYISENEIKASKQYGKNYYIYRLYGLGKSNRVKFYIIQGPLSEDENIVLRATTYLALPKKK